MDDIVVVVVVVSEVMGRRCAMWRENLRTGLERSAGHVILLSPSISMLPGLSCMLDLADTPVVELASALLPSYLSSNSP